MNRFGRLGNRSQHLYTFYAVNQTTGQISKYYTNTLAFDKQLDAQFRYTLTLKQEPDFILINYDPSNNPLTATLPEQLQDSNDVLLYDSNNQPVYAQTITPEII